MNTSREKTKQITQAALIAACYIVLTLLSQLVGLASGPIQFRISEALTILPVLTGAAVPGLLVGCVLANIISGCAIWDVIFGSLATLIAALTTYYLGKKAPRIGWIPPVITNTIIVPLMLQFVYGAEGSYWYFLLTVFIGELVCCGGIGSLLYQGLKSKIKYLK